MTREEFEAHVAKVLPEGKTAPDPTDAEYKLIEYVYNFHPAISETDGKEQIAELYVKFGMCLINDNSKFILLMCGTYIRNDIWELLYCSDNNSLATLNSFS